MIEQTKLKSSDLGQVLPELEALYLDELENMLLSRLMEKKSIQLHGEHPEVLEFAGRTNYKLRLRQPSKNVWSISFKEFRESIRKVLRNGTIGILCEGNKMVLARKEKLDHPTVLLLNVLPECEYENRSFVGNKVHHALWGEGRIVSISESGNVEVAFGERTVTLKPDFIKLHID